MKKCLTLLFAFVMLGALSGWSQTSATSTSEKLSAKSSKMTTVRGMVSADGKTFVADKDKKTWTVSNPEKLKGEEGHHVSLRGQLNAAKNEIEVSSVRVLSATKSSSKKKTTTS